ncbi:MAG: putative Ig domain-containing protein, partial [bacterium]
GLPALPNGLTMDVNGLISGTPNDTVRTYSSVVTVDDSCFSGSQTDSQAFNLVLVDPDCDSPLTIDDNPAPDATIGSGYLFQMTATGGFPPLHWTICDNPLPPGLVLADGGRITGTPPAGSLVGDYNPTICVVDECPFDPQSDTGGPSITLHGACGDPFIGNTGFSNCSVGTPYEAVIIITGGQAPYIAEQSGGTLPDGLTVNFNGTDWVVSGTASNGGQGGQTFFFSIKATDSCPAGGAADENTFSIQVNGT